MVVCTILLLAVDTAVTPAEIQWHSKASIKLERLGGWSSFALQIGSPAQIVRVLISTAGQATWAISSLRCPPDLPPSCSQLLGGVFNNNDSKSWDQKGFFGLGLETNLYPPDNATFGLDSVGLGLTNASGPVLENQIVAALSGSTYAQGTFGLGRQPTNLSDFTDPHPSFLTSLYNKNLIPSLSWSYTAGAKYRQKGVYGSLTFGGYDAARFTPSNITFDLATDISRDLVLFERVFGLVWNATYQMYLVDDALHDTLVTRRPSFTFELGNAISGGPTVEITLPYDSFDLSFRPGIDSDPVRYFPIQRAADDSQLTLGRAFLQEAYLTTDYERSKFSVSQCKFEETRRQEILPILSTNAPSTTDTVPGPPSVNPAHLGRQKIIGI
ncbi:MAG: hypothetical protein Q9196_005328, partial [Gyalolechia fulgens]